MPILRRVVVLIGTAGLLAAAVSAAAQSSSPRTPASPAPPASPNARIVEEIIVRVNNDIITRSELEHSRQSLWREIEEQECKGCTREQIEAMFRQRELHLLRDLIDQSLLVQRAKEAGFNVDADVVRQLDAIRQRNNLASMEDLESAVTATGMPFEEFRANLRDNLLTQEVIRRDVGPTIRISRDEIRKFYEENQDKFHRPELVSLREIFVSTEGKDEAEIPELEKRARGLLERVRAGEDFAELAKRFSNGSTAAQGGVLGDFQRGQLSPEFEERVFKMNRGDITDIIRTRGGLLILRVDERYEAGLQPIDKVENEIQNHIYVEKLQPQLREFLKKLREESYVVVRPGYVDSAAVGFTPIEEVAPKAEEVKEDEENQKKFWQIWKRKKKKDDG